MSPNARRVPLSDADLVRNRAAALATKLGLSPADEAELLAVLLEEQTRRAATLAELRRKPDDAEVNARVRTELSAILAWKTEKLRSRFGFERANLLMQRR